MNSKLILKLLFGISILGLIFYQVGLTQLATIAFRIEFDQLLLVLSLSLFSLTLGAVNFAILVAPYKRLKFIVVLKNYLLSWAIGNLFPAKLGEASICLLLNNEGIKIGDTFVAFVVDRFISLFTVLFFATIGACYFYLELNYFAASISSVSIFAISAFVFNRLFLSKSLRSATWTKRLVGYLLNEDTRESIAHYFSAIRSPLSINFVLSILKLLLHAGIVLYIFSCIGIDLNIIDVLTIHSMVIFIILIPISFNGLGVKEAVAAVMYSNIDVGFESSVTVYLLIVALTYLLTAAVFATLGLDALQVVKSLRNRDSF